MRTLTWKVRQRGEVKALLRRELGLSAGAVRRAKETGIFLDGVPVFTNAVAEPGQMLSVAVGDGHSNPDIPPVEGVLSIPYEDEDMLIVDKAGGMPVHPSQGHHGDTLANFLLYHYETQGLVAAFHPVNRLDRGTSGLMAVAKHAHAHERLQAQLQEGTLTRTYLAVCRGCPPEDRGTIREPIRRVPGSVLMREVHPDGAKAVTRYEVLQTGQGNRLVRLRLETGRTHQIRVHMAFLGCPLVGDFLYGEESPDLPGRFALHSTEIRLRQPVTGEEIHLHSPLPEALERLLG